MFATHRLPLFATLLVFVLCGLNSPAQTAAEKPAQVQPGTVHITIQIAGPGAGAVTTADGAECEDTCSADFARGSEVILTAASKPGSTFEGWSGACSGSGMCALHATSDATAMATFATATGISAIQHIVFLVQENRSLDNYFGALREYWAQNGYPDESFDGLAQFNPASGAAPLKGTAPSIPGCNPSDPPPSDCIFDPSHLITSYRLNTVCTENTSPSWNEAHVDWNYYAPMGNKAAAMNGFVKTAGHDARYIKPPFYDVNGIRGIGYYDGTQLNYYYFLASNFATSDRWFNPAMTRTNPNREYLLAGTSHGYAYPNGTNSRDTAQLTVETIFQKLQAAGVSWKIYVNPKGTGCSGPPYSASCLMKQSYLQNFTWGKTAVADYPSKFAPISQYFTDVKNGTLPDVAYIAPASSAGLDEHGSDSDKYPVNVEKGAQYVSTLINALMKSSSWSNSVFILTYDEFGGLYDHVAPQQTVSPDGIKPVDLQPGDICNKGTTGPTCDFVYTGFRVPLLVISPFAKKHYVSHTVADYTAILKFIETRYGLSALTKRDAAQMDMTEFFDFNTPSWPTPPTPPAQVTSGSCYLNKLP